MQYQIITIMPASDEIQMKKNLNVQMIDNKPLSQLNPLKLFRFWYRFTQINVTSHIQRRAYHLKRVAHHIRSEAIITFKAFTAETLYPPWHCSSKIAVVFKNMRLFFFLNMCLLKICGFFPYFVFIFVLLYHLILCLRFYAFFVVAFLCKYVQKQIFFSILAL